MKRRILLTAVALAVSTGIHAAGNADEHHHGHGHGEPQKLQLNAGKKWATDEHLRRSMSDINQALASALPAIHKNRFGDDEYLALATTVKQQVGYAIEHCKLDPQADAMLHLVIADLMAGADAMEGKTSHPRHDGAVRVLEALKAYGKYFQHPGWKVAKG